MSKKQSFQETLKEVESVMASISDLETKKVLNKLLNLVETIHSENEELKEENQQLKDEVSHLKGEQGKPDIKGKKNDDISSEQERKANSTDDDTKKGKKKKRKRKPKLPRIKIDREEICPVDKSTLPKDIEFKGHSDVVIQVNK